MKPLLIAAGGLFLLALAGCATSPQAQQSLDQAHAAFDAVKDNADVLHAAPKDVIRAGESLARADRLSSYSGSDDDVVHFAYLSQRYSAIATEHGKLTQNNERLAALELERQRLQLTLREAKLLSVQQQGALLDAQMASVLTSNTERGLVMTLGDVLFDTGHSELKASANRTVLKLAQFLQLNPRRVIRIEGYSDGRGDAKMNLELSRARAQSVADMLEDLGVDAKRMQVQALGEAYPVAENASSIGRAQNRRVEIVFSDEKGHLSSER